MPGRRESSRAAVLKAGYELIGELGYDRATTALVCARAGVSSGTFFHYFPTKTDLLTGILESSADETRARDAQLTRTAQTDPAEALEAWLRSLVREATDPYLPGFVAGIGPVTAQEAVAGPLRAAAASTHAALTAMVESGQRLGLWRDDRAAEALALWLGVLADGVLTRSAEDPGFDVGELQEGLRDLVQKLLAPTSSTKP